MKKALFGLMVAALLAVSLPAAACTMTGCGGGYGYYNQPTYYSHNQPLQGWGHSYPSYPSYSQYGYQNYGYQQSSWYYYPQQTYYYYPQTNWSYAPSYSYSYSYGSNYDYYPDWGGNYWGW